MTAKGSSSRFQNYEERKNPFGEVEIERQNQPRECLGLLRENNCTLGWKRRIGASGDSVGDPLTVMDVGNNVDSATVCQQDHEFEPGISMGAPAFRC